MFVADCRVPPCSYIDHVNTLIYSARVTAEGGIQAQSFAFQDFRNDPALFLPGYTNRGPLVESMTDSMGSVTSLGDGCVPSYQAIGTMFQVPPGLSEAPYYSDALAHSQVIQDPLHTVAVQSTTTPPYSASSVVQPRDYPATHSRYQASSPFEAFAGNVTVFLSLFPSPTVSTPNGVSVTTPSNTIHICRCSSACNAVLNGSIRAVRSHLKQEHQFRGAAKESIRCLWAGCQRILQRENIPRHIITRHLRVKVSCPACGIALSRRDVQYSHARVCRAKGQASSSQLRTDVSSAIARSTISDGSNPF
jgi:hypothetical protein